MESKSSEIPLIAYCLKRPVHEIVPASPTRAWMDSTPDKWAYRCLPLLIANQAGWFILNPEPVEAIWHGGNFKHDLEVLFSGKYKSLAPVSHFGYGVLTWNFSWLFRTPPGYNIAVRGPTNWPKDGIVALDGIVETDWASATFSMNWKFTRPGVRVRFEAGEPLCMIYLQKRHELESVTPEMRPIQSEPGLEEQHLAWSQSRIAFQKANLETIQAIPRHVAWQKHYFRGKHVAGGSATEHQNKLAIKPFANRSTQGDSPLAIAPDVTPPLEGMKRTPSHIPQLLHQILTQVTNDSALTTRLEGYRKTWAHQNPDWEIKIWTLASGRELIANHHSWFLPLYDSYPQDRMRADALRYFLLATYGGTYADVDTECLQPFHRLLQAKDLLVGCEPNEPCRSQAAHKAGLGWLIATSVISSVPEHSFWPEVFRALVKYNYRRDPLEATGTILLTRAYESFPKKSSIHLVDSAVMSPLTKTQAQAKETEGVELRRSFVLHHWDAEDHFDELALELPAFLSNLDKLEVNLLVQGRVLTQTNLRLPVVNDLKRSNQSNATISCLMVAGSAEALVMLSIRSFQQQTWQTRELIIVDAGSGLGLEESVRQLSDPRICYRRASAGTAQGEAMQIALAEASGEWIAYWADDELSHPQRLELQFAAVEALSAGASFLQRRFIFHPVDERLTMSRSRVWEQTLFCRKDLAGNGGIRLNDLLKQQRVAMVDRALLYLEIRHNAKWANPKWDQASISYDAFVAKQIRDLLQGFFPFEEIEGLTALLL